MLRKIVVGIFAVALVSAVSGNAQMKDQTKERTARRVVLKAVDINSASQTEIAGVGLTDSEAKKIVENRPYRNKRELMTRSLVTAEQYEKIKGLIVAKRPKKKQAGG